MDPKVKMPMQAVVVRYLHDASVGEVLNLGVVVLCEGRRFLGARFLSSWTRITAAFRDAEPPHLRRLVRAIEQHCESFDWSQPTLSKQNLVEMLKTILPMADQGIVFSDVISGITRDPERSLAELFARLVTTDDLTPRAARGDEDVWRTVSGFVPAALIPRIRSRTIADPTAPSFKIEFKHAWENAQWHAAQPLSLDLDTIEGIQKKTAQWIGNIIAIEPKRLDTFVHLIVGAPSSDQPLRLRTAADLALELLDRKLRGHAVEVLEERDAKKLAHRIETDLLSHDLDSSSTSDGSSGAD